MEVGQALVQSQVRCNRVTEKVPETVPEKVWEALVQSQVKFNRVPEQVPDKVWEALVQSQVRLNRVLEKVWEASVQSKVRFSRICGHLIHGNPAGVLPAPGCRKICKKILRLRGIPPKLIFFPPNSAS